MCARTITCEKDGLKDIHCAISSETNALLSEVFLVEFSSEIADPSDFGMKVIPSSAVVYEIRTNDRNLLWKALWSSPEKKLRLAAVDTEEVLPEVVNLYEGSLEECILQAYEDRILR